MLRSVFALSAAAFIICAFASEPPPASDKNAQPPAAPALAAKPSSIAPPPLLADKPVDLPGMHNVVTYAEGLYSGGAPEGETAFQTLAAIGVKTIISVDGAQPDVELAKKHGLRYVHLPIGYDGMDRKRTLEIAKAIKELPGPTYVHCHHGKHRSAGALGAAAVALGLATPEKITERMKVSGTSPSYKGLYQCVAVATVATPAELAATSSEFPEHWKTSGLVQSMVEIDHAFEHLKEIEKADWKAPAEHPDLVPAAEAGRLADLLRNLKDDAEVKSHPSDFTTKLMSSAEACAAIEELLLQSPPPAADLSAKLKLATQSCKDCHVAYRD